MLAFIRQALGDFQHTGAVWPSSRKLAGAMTRTFRESSGPRMILEVGPGTGPFTRVILRTLRKGDEFHIVEINSDFCLHLEKTLLGPFRKANPDIKITLHQCPIQEVALEGNFDHIVCGLPFNNFQPELVRSIFRTMMSLLKANGDLAYFEYAAVRYMKSPVVGRKGRMRLKRIDAHAKLMHRQHSGTRELVVANFPPAVAVRLIRT